MIVLDTNVISELMRDPAKRDTAVVEWFSTVDGHDCRVTTLTVAEVRFGLNIIASGRRRDRLMAAFDDLLASILVGRILPFDMAAAERFAIIAADRVRDGRHIPIDDLRIAAIAGCRGMAVATRNVRDFEDSGVQVVNPWEFQQK